MIDKEPCKHIEKLKEYLKKTGLDVFSEFSEEPSGWVSVHCEICRRTYDVDLRIYRYDNE